MIYFYVISILLLLLSSWSIVASLDRIAKNLGVVATCNVFWMVYHGHDKEIAEAGRIIAAKVSAAGVEDVAVSEATTK